MNDKKFPLGMPEGSVRAMIALFVVAVIVLGYIAAIFTGFVFPAELLAIAGLVIGYYFGTREK